jgi:D-glycero-D-manno-heptose 1,7-bisphosphate phosphatase
MKIAFLDRDGTINKDYQDDEWKNIYNPEFLKGSLEALRVIREKGFQIIIITNQYLINDGVITLSQYKMFTEKLIKIVNEQGVKILDIFYCPHSKKENCNCSKPKTGLIDNALKKYPNIELDKSFIVGDSIVDMELGNKLGIRTFGINVNSEILSYIPVSSLLDATRYLY